MKVNDKGSGKYSRETVKFTDRSEVAKPQSAKPPDIDKSMKLTGVGMSRPIHRGPIKRYPT